VRPQSNDTASLPSTSSTNSEAHDILSLMGNSVYYDEGLQVSLLIGNPAIRGEGGLSEGAILKLYGKMNCEKKRMSNINLMKGLHSHL